MALPPRPHRPVLLPLLLVAIVLLAGVLAYEAFAALREREAMATRSLRDFVAFAASELSAKAGETMAQEARQALDPITAIPATSPYDRLDALDAIQGAEAGVLPCGDSLARRSSGSFQLDLRDGSLQLTGSPPPALRRWLADTLGSLVRVAYRPEQRFAVLPDVPGDTTQVLLFAVKWSQLGAHAQPMAPIGVVGFFRCRSAFGIPLVRRVMARRPLLPGALGGGRPNDSVLVVQLSDASGREIWRTGVDAAAGLDASVPLDTPAGLRLAVALRATAVAGLTVGAPATLGRVPWLLALLAVSVGLVAVAFAQIRRELELARLRSDFTSSVSHELRTPLAQILLAAETLELGRARTEEARSAAASLIVGEGRRLLYLVENVLSFARLTRGVPVPRPKPTRLAPLCREILTQWLATIGVAARIVPDLDETAWAMVDAGTMTQILHNLVDNAVKFGPPGQTITIVVRRERDRVVLTVTDEGPGVAVADRGRIWEPFVRAADGGPAGGTGLGLAVVRDLVAGLNGTARVESPAGAGARFVVELPGCPPATPDPARRDSLAGDRQ